MRRSFVALALAVLLPVPVLAADVTVKPGETLSDIAARYGISLTQLMKLNRISKADHIEVGQVLKVPGPTRTAAGRGGVATGSVTVREGETLSEIAARQGMGLGQLMALNGISKADHVEVGQVIKVTGKPPAAAPSYRRGASTHVVRPGESLSEIAEGYGLSMNRLVAINQIDDPNHVEIGRQLKLKGEAPAPRPVAAAPVARPKPSPVAATPQPRPAAPRPAAAEDSRPAVSTTPVGEGAVSRATEAASLAARPSTPAVATPIATTPVATTAVATAPATSWSTPAQARPTPVATTTPVQAAAAAPRPISTAMASPAPRPATVSPTPRPAATTVAKASGVPSTAAATSSGDWRRYGPLQVDWSNWQPMGGSLVAPILNAKGDTLYMAINCGARKMNATSVAGDWRTWDNPQADFELKLVNDLCRSRG